MLKCKIGNVASVVKPLLKADIVPILWGPSAIGKTDIIKSDIMAFMNSEFGETTLHHWHGAGMDERDAFGVPAVNIAEKETVWTRPALVPKEDGKSHLIFIDDYGHASRAVQQVFYSLFHGKHVGGYRLPAKTWLIAASNRKEDKGGDNAMLKPMEARVAHLSVDVDVKAFLEHAKTVMNFHPVYLAWLSFRPELVYKPDADNPAWPSPRKHEMANRVLQQTPMEIAEKCLVSLIGEGAARDCAQFFKDAGAALPKLAEIKRNPESCRIPAETHHQYVIASAIGQHIDAESVETWAKYLRRLSPDLASMAANTAMTRDSRLGGNKTLEQLRLG